MKIKKTNNYWGGTYKVYISLNEVILFIIMLLGTILLTQMHPEPINKKTKAATLVKHNINL